MCRSPKIAGVCLYGLIREHVLKCAVLIVCVVPCGKHVLSLSVAAHHEVVPAVGVLCGAHQLLLPLYDGVPPVNGFVDIVGAHCSHSVAVHVEQYTVSFDIDNLVCHDAAQHLHPVLVRVAALVEISVDSTALDVYPYVGIIG